MNATTKPRRAFLVALMLGTLVGGWTGVLMGQTECATEDSAMCWTVDLSGPDNTTRLYVGVNGPMEDPAPRTLFRLILG